MCQPSARRAIELKAHPPAISTDIMTAVRVAAFVIARALPVLCTPCRVRSCIALGKQGHGRRLQALSENVYAGGVLSGSTAPCMQGAALLENAAESCSMRGQRIHERRVQHVVRLQGQSLQAATDAVHLFRPCAAAFDDRRHECGEARFFQPFCSDSST